MPSLLQKWTTLAVHAKILPDVYTATKVDIAIQIIRAACKKKPLGASIVKANIESTTALALLLSNNALLLA